MDSRLKDTIAKSRALSPSLLLASFGFGLLVASIPLAQGRELTPAEMIQSRLPAQTTAVTARKSDLLFAVCRAIKEHPDAAAAITSAAVAARKEFAGDIVGTVLRCSGRDDCEFIGTVVAAAVAAAADSAGPAGEAAMARAPACADVIRRIARPTKARAKENTATSTSIGDGSTALPSTNTDPTKELNPLERLRLVCDDGVQRALRESQLSDYLETHPGAVIGTCPPATSSPSPSKGSSITPNGDALE